MSNLSNLSICQIFYLLSFFCCLLQGGIIALGTDIYYEWQRIYGGPQKPIVTDLFWLKKFFFLIQQTTWIWFEDNHTNWSNESRDEIYQPQILGFNLYFDDENRHNEYVIDCTKPNVWSDDYLDDESEPRVSRWWQPFF